MGAHVTRGRGRRYTAWQAALVLAALAGLTAARPARADVSLAAWIQHSPDDISGFTTISGDDSVTPVTMPFSVKIEGVNYNTVAISTNGWLEFGGNTQGTSHPGNVCLPTATHTNPFLAAYWDDLDTIGTNIRYGTVGSSPNRTFIVDYEVDLVSGAEGSDDLRFQVQVHERSNLITVRYRDQQSATNGIAATIGFQGAGGASGTALPLTCNGKVMDDDRSDEGWSVDAGRAGLATLAAHMESSPNDLTGFTTLTGDNATAGVTMPFSVTIEGTSYNTLTLGTNGVVQFGTTSGANPTGNASLPSASFPNPTIFYYWDDLQTEGGNIRYATVGSSPNRTFIIDFQENLVASTGDKVNGQVQIHERSNLINVKYRSTLSAAANGQAATIGFQGAGGASAAAYPLTFNGKILDDNRPDEGWSVHPKALGAMSLHANLEYSPDDITGFTTLSGDNAIAGVTLPFSVTIDGTSYSTLTIGTNGLIQLGTTSGANPTGNGSLPSATFPNPTIFYFWDDLQTEGGNIRYGTVGSSPNRTFIVDFQENLVAASGDKVNGQVQIHERSNLINVTYRSTMSAGANGQTATIGFQGAGGASAAAYPLTFNGKILDDNLPDAGWSIAPLPVCGNSIAETKEQCDLGGSNGTAGACCTSTCGFTAVGTTCRGSAGVCDVAETCTGSSATCPANGFAAPTLVCRAPAGVCDIAEQCTGAAAACPADGKSTAPCRAAAGVCDLAESCDGVNDACPADMLVPPSTVCRGAADVCDVAETCDGFTADCPADGFAPASVTCRAAGGVCDVAESCTGSAAACPADAKSTALCRAAAGACDLAESCDGSGDQCPSDAKSTAECRAAAGACDVAESCDGASDACPADTVRPSGHVCLPGSGDVCDPSSVCDGSDTACPADVVAPAGTVCRNGSGDVCDPDEVCSGVATEPCPPDVVEADTTVCRPGSGDLCDPDELCPGIPAGTCAADVVLPPTAVCRPGSGDACDPDELCPGIAAGTCAAEVVAPPGTVCNPGSGDLCDPDETCSGTAGEACPTDTVAPATTACRAAAGVCDAAELCTGVADATCPSDAKQPGTTVCRAATDLCDMAETCDGSTNTCPSDAKQPDGTSCSDGMFCNGAETCQSATCIGGSDPCTLAAICSEATDECLTTVCPATPQTCRLADKSVLLIKNKPDNTKDKLLWKFLKGAATTQAEFADPTTTAEYALCIYAGPMNALVAEVHVPPGGGRWAATGSKGYKYLDPTFAADGAQIVILKGTGVAGKTKVLLKARGENAPDPLDQGMLPYPVTAQMFNYGNGICWQSSFTAAGEKKNTPEQFKALQ